MIRGRAVRDAVEGWVRLPTLVLGVGNSLRGDDAVGPLVCARVDGPRAVDCGDAPERYLGLAGEEWVGRVLLVDAVDFGGEVGEVVFCTSDELVERFGTTHDSGLALLTRFLEKAYGTPTALLGVQPGNTSFGAQVSAVVLAAVDEIASWLTVAASQRKPGEVETAWTRS